MKFLVLALCVCAASAAYTGYRPYQPVQSAKAFAQVTPQAVASAAYVAPKAVYQAAQAVASVPVAAAKTIYEVGKDATAAVLRSESDVAADSFRYVYETQNGISAEASGSLKNVNNEATLTVQGAFKYSSPDGSPVEFTYVADENGYQPQSNVLPVGPAIPVAILRALEYLRTHAPANPEKY